MNKFLFVLALSALFFAGCIGTSEEVQEEYCTKEGTSLKMSFTEAKNIAQNSACTQEGPLGTEHWCNEVTGTWWIDMNIEKEGCNPACVINVETGEAEINWMCTGLKE
ncbi:hypothetical protein JXB01_02100 [Candidatus Micrarchaeota archaeon]|nr:hypothetical protein [Candidatus Micrarchaeota archaeon]